MTAPTETRREDGSERAGLSGGVLSVIFLGMVVVGVLAAWLLPDRQTATATVGQPAPALTFVTFEGETFDMVEHFQRGGGPVLLNLWASWCEPCIREFPVLSEFAADNPDVTVVGVAVQDQEEDARSFAQQLDPAFPVGWDRDDSIRDSYPSFGLPATFAIGPDGTVTDIVLAELTHDRLERISFTG